MSSKTVMTRRALVGLNLCAGLWLSCSDDGGATTVPDATSDVADSDGDVVSVVPRITANPANSLSAFVDWQTPVAGTTRVELECEGEYDVEVADSGSRREHQVYVQGAWPEATCRVTVSSQLNDGRRASGQAVWEVGPLLEELPELSVTTHRREAVEPGWTLFDVTGQPDERPLRFVVIDEQGRYRWFHRRAGDTRQASANDVSLVPEGLLLGGSGWVGVKPAVISWDGTVQWEGSINQHHDIRVWPDDDSFIYLSVDPDCPDFNSHSVRMIDRTSGADLWTWRHCEHFVPEPPFEDWSHLNAVEPVPGENAILISSRHQSALFKVDVSTGEIEWMLGFPPRDYAPADLPRIALAESDRFWRQHSPEIESNGNILLFDNGSEERPYSRVIELAVDQTAMTADVVWEYRHDPDIYAGQWGDADRLSNGNTLTVFGLRSGEGSRLVEVDSAAQVVWEVVTPAEWGIYRAERIAPEAFPAGYLVDP